MKQKDPSDRELLKLLEGAVDTKGEGYAARMTFHRVLRRILRYFVYPVTLLSIVLGCIFCLEIGVRAVFPGKDTPAPGTGTETDIDTKTETEAAQSEAFPPITTDAPESDVQPVGPDTEEEPFLQSEEWDIPLALSEYYYLTRDQLPDNIYGYNYNLVPPGELPILPMNLARPTSGGVMYASNSSGYPFDYLKYAERPFPVSYKESDDYQILIVHTHGTEGYTEDGEISYDPNKSFPRSKDITKNVVAVGAAMAEVFEANGIKTLHCEIPIDEASYNESYQNAAKIIKQYLKDYPSIKYVFDIHRDALLTRDQSKVRPVCQVDGKLAAQVMFVIGTDAKTHDHPRWENNLTAAVKLQLYLEDKYENFVRPLNIKNNTYNQEYSELALLIEVGTDGNTLEEAKYSGRLVAEAISQILKDA